MAMRHFKTLATGKLIDGKYRIDAIVGTGGMGTVYRATRLDIDRQVALKLLHPEMLEDPVVVERFQREAHAAGSIGHDNICEVTELGTSDDGTPYLIMPLLIGSSLARAIDRGPLPIPRVMDIMSQTLSALQAAHDARIIHRDLKPDNVFITRVGDREDFVKILDFGVSKILSQDSIVHLTRTGSMPGTPFYMAPELAKGSKHIDSRADIYAAGVIMYEVLTGQKPFIGESYNEIMFNILTEPFQAPSILNPEVTAEIENIVLTSMSRDPSQRYQSAEEMRRALLVVTGAISNFESARDNVKPAAVPGGEAPDETALDLMATTPEAQATSDRRSPRGRIFIGVLVAALIVAIATATVRLLTTSDEPPPPKLVVPLSNQHQVENQQEVRHAVVPADEIVVDRPHALATPKQEETNKAATSPTEKAKKKKSRRLRKTSPERPKNRAIPGRSGTTFFTDFD